MTTLDQTQPSAEHLGSSLEFETLIADLSSRFINLPPGEVGREIDDALRHVCEFVGIDLAVLWQWSGTNPAVITPTHIYIVREDLRSPEPLHHKHYPWVVRQVLAGRTVCFSSVDELPAEAATDLEYARQLGIKSNLTLPLSVGDELPVGALALNTLRVQRDWPEGLVQRLQLVTQVFTNALARRRHELTLQESEERLSLAADSAEAGLWTLDYGTGVFWATDQARALFGYAPDEVLSLGRFGESVHPDDWDRVRGAVERSARSGEPINEEYRIILPGDGSVRWIASRGRPKLSSSDEPESLTGISIDITERRRNQEAFRTSEARLTAGADLAGLAFYELDFANNAAFVDERFRDICGVPPEREQNLGVLEFWIEHLHPVDRDRVLYLREELHAGRLERLSTEYRFVNPVRGELWIHHLGRIARRDAAGRPVVAYGVLREVTERKRIENELRDLSRRLIQAHEEERALLARELHDDVTQRLAVLAIEVGRVQQAASNEAQVEALEEVRGGLVRLSEDIHSLAYQLHPSVLEELGLAEALRAECERRRRQVRFDITMDFDALPATVRKDAALCLFRVAQEALNNVTRHADARAARISLRIMDGGLLLSVRDDGVGFDPTGPGKGRHLGLASMGERVRLVHGTLDIESAPGRGTTVVAWVPAQERSP